MEAGTLMIKLVGDITDLQRKMNDAQRSVAGAMAGVERSVNMAKNALGMLGIGLSVNSVVTYATAIIDSGDAMNDLSQRVGIAVGDLAKYQLATSQSGTTMESLAKGVKGLSTNMYEHGDALKKAGLSATTADQAMLQFADLFASMPDGVEKTALAVKVFGKSGMELIPMLNMGRKGLEEAAEKAAKYAAVMTAMAPQADVFNDQLAEIGLYSKVAGMNMMNDMLPALIAITQKMAEAAQKGGMLKGMMAGFDELGNQALDWNGNAQRKQIKWLSDDLKELQDEQKAITMDIFGRRGQIQTEIEAKTLALQTAQKAYFGLKDGNGGRGSVNPKVVKPEIDWRKDFEAYMKALKESTNGSGGTDSILKAQQSFIDNLEKQSDRLTLNSVQAGLNEAAKLGITGAELAHVKSLLEENEAYKAAMATAKERQSAREKEYESIRQYELQQGEELIKKNKAYKDATASAAAYIDTLNTQYAREVGGIGKGTQYRATSAGLSSIEDKQTSTRQGLDKDLRNGTIGRAEYDQYLAIAADTYAKEVQAYNKRNIDIAQAQGNWVNGYTEALANYQTAAQDVAGNTAAMFTSAFDGMTNGVAQSVTDMLLHGKSLQDGLAAVAMSVADAFITSFIKIQIQKLFIDKAAAGTYAATMGMQAQAMVMMAGLNAFASTAAIPIVGPLLAPEAAGAAMAIAEAMAVGVQSLALASVASARGGFDIPVGVNPLTQLHEQEMVLPKQQANVIRDLAKDGSAGRGNITIINKTSAPIGAVTERTNAAGDRELTIEAAVATVSAQMGDPNSKISRSMQRNFSTQRSR